MAVPTPPELAGQGDGPSSSGRRRARHRRPAQRRSRWRTGLLVLAALLVAGVGVGIGAAGWTVGHYGSNVTRIEAALPTGERPPAPEVVDDGGAAPLTFALVGVDSGYENSAAGNAESVSLVRLTGDRQHAQLVSFPLDTWVDEPAATLETAYGEGDRAGLVQALETLTDVRIDHYAEIDFAGFQSMVDALGGVDVEVREPYRNRGYEFEPGSQRLDGAAALAYVRDADDAARSGSAGRQQRVVAALFRAVSASGVGEVGALTGTLESLTGSLAVDDTLGNSDLVQLAWSLRGIDEPDFVSVPVAGTGTEAGTSVQYVDPERSAALFEYLAADSLADHLPEFA